MFRTFRSIQWVALSVAAIAAVGCNIDGSAGNKPLRAKENAQTTSLEHPAGMNVPAIQVADRTEVDLVEQTILHRTMYARHLKVLIEYYTEHGHETKANWARNELNDLKRVKPYRYIMDAETPVAQLAPAQSVAEADRLYEEAVALMKKGGHGVPVFFNQTTMKLALAKFKELVDTYPTSDKIDDAAFMIGEIHKEYFEEKDNTLALEWYQRALDWNPQTEHPVRFQMAVVYDYRMHDRDRALDMYQEVLKHEQYNRSNIEWANARIGQLTREKTRYAAGEPIPNDRPTLSASGAPEPAAGGSAAEASPAPRNLP